MIYTPETVPKGEASVLAIVRTHYGERVPELFRQAYIDNPVSGVCMIDGFPEAAERGQRNLRNCFPEGNLSCQYGNEPVLGESPIPPSQAEILRCTRSRAARNLSFARQFKCAVDIHSCKGYSYAWANANPTAGVLDLLSALSYKDIVVSDEYHLPGVMDGAVLLEMAEERQGQLAVVRQALGELAAGHLCSGSTGETGAFNWYEFAGDLTQIDSRRLGLKSMYDPFEPLPDAVREHLGCEGQTYALCWTTEPRDGYVGEIVTDYVEH